MSELRLISVDSADKILGESGLLSQLETTSGVDMNKLFELSLNHKRNNGYEEIDLNAVEFVLNTAVNQEKYFIENAHGIAAATFQEQWIAPRLHYSLRLSRSEASNPQIWNYLGLYFNEYITKRWTGKKGYNQENSKPLEYHYLLKKWDRHQLAKLWWMAELTKNNGNYHETGGVLNTDFIQQVLGRLAPQSHQYNLAILSLENDVFGDGKIKLDSNWVRIIYKLINTKILTESGSVKATVELDHENAVEWYNSKPDIGKISLKGELPPAPSDISVDTEDIAFVVTWIRAALNEQRNSEWKYLNDAACKLLVSSGKPLSTDEIFELGKKSNIWKKDWQKRELGVSLGLDSRISQKNGKWNLI